VCSFIVMQNFDIVDKAFASAVEDHQLGFGSMVLLQCEVSTSHILDYCHTKYYIHVKQENLFFKHKSGSFMFGLGQRKVFSPKILCLDNLQRCSPPGFTIFDTISVATGPPWGSARELSLSAHMGGGPPPHSWLRGG
jgi:hypothetical protein